MRPSAALANVRSWIVCGAGICRPFILLRMVAVICARRSAACPIRRRILRRVLRRQSRPRPPHLALRPIPPLSVVVPSSRVPLRAGASYAAAHVPRHPRRCRLRNERKGGRSGAMAAIGFDVYGTLVDPLEMERHLRALLGGQAGPFAARWREKQLEYTFRRAADAAVRLLRSLHRAGARIRRPRARGRDERGGAGAPARTVSAVAGVPRRHPRHRCA